MLKILDNKFLVLYIIPFCLGSISILSFQPFNLTFVNFVSLSSLFLILCYVNKKTKNIYRKKPFLMNLFLVGYFFGIGFFLFGNYWISYSLTVSNQFYFLIPFSIILLPLFLGLFFGLTTLFVGKYLKHNLSSVLLFCASLSLADFIRSKILTGFPWNLWAYSWSWFVEIIQLVNLTGLFAFNLISITLFCIPTVLFFKKYKFKYLSIFTLILIFLSMYVYGSFKINQNQKTLTTYLDNQRVNFKVISPNLNLNYNLNDEDLLPLLNKMIKYSEPEKDKETVFIWPEGVFTGYYYSDLLKFKKIIKKSFSEKHIIIFGANTQGEDLNNFFNSFIVINNNFEILYKYDKTKLVPFGEFLPFNNILEKLGFKKITYGAGSFSKGVKLKNFNYKNINILPAICYEIIFTEIFQNSDLDTNLIINISEDAWFGNSIGPHQHFSKAVFRAVENNSFLIRSANKGISAIINNKGIVQKILSNTEAGNIELNIPILKNENKNRNDLIFFILLLSYICIFLVNKKYYEN